jgi:Uma2 family endonuclease
MSVVDLPYTHTPIAESGAKLFRFTRDHYYRLTEAGLFEGRHIQLIEGQIIEMAPQKDQHAACVRIVQETLRTVFGSGFTVQSQLPLDIGEHSQPEPDVCVLSGTPRQHLCHPKTALLVIEVSDTTLRYDREVKAPLYAAAGLQEYWIVNLVDRRIEVFRAPVAVPNPLYSESLTFSGADALSPLSAAPTKIACADLLP